MYRLSKDPQALDLRTVASAVGGDAKSRHGIVLAKSPLAKKYGVTTGEPLVQALRKIWWLSRPGLIFTLNAPAA